MKGLTKTACALLMTGGLAAPAPAASGDAGSGPTNGANAGSMNRITSGQNSMTNGQSSMNGQNGLNAGHEDQQEAPKRSQQGGIH